MPTFSRSAGTHLAHPRRSAADGDAGHGRPVVGGRNRARARPAVWKSIPANAGWSCWILSLTIARSTGLVSAMPPPPLKPAAQNAGAPVTAVPRPSPVARRRSGRRGLDADARRRAEQGRPAPRRGTAATSVFVSGSRSITRPPARSTARTTGACPASARRAGPARRAERPPARPLAPPGEPGPGSRVARAAIGRRRRRAARASRSAVRRPRADRRRWRCAPVTVAPAAPRSSGSETAAAREAVRRLGRLRGRDEHGEGGR